MKKRLYTLSVIALLLSANLLTGCNDFFDPDNNDSVRQEDFATSREDLNAGALGIYAALSQEVHKFLLWGSARADLVKEGIPGQNAYIAEFVNNEVTDRNPYTNYGGLYTAIARCNHQIENIAKVSKIDFSLDDNSINAFYGEAYYLRALCYFYLVRTFKEFPIILDDLSEKITRVTEQGDTIHLNTLDLTKEELRTIALKPANETEAWAQIYSDVKKAMGLLRVAPKWNGVNTSNLEKYGRATLASAYALGADIALWLGEYLKASAYADLVRTNSNYDVTSQATWGNAFTSATASPHDLALLAYDFSQSHETNLLQEFTSNIPADEGKYLLKPVKEILDSLFAESEDIRPAYTYKRINGKDLIWKYIGLDGETAMRKPYQSTASWHLYRSADIYLIKGLAENRRGNPGGGLTFLNMLRKNRGLKELEAEDIDLSMENLEDLLLAERAKELAFEGKRWYDLLLVSKVFGRKNLLPATISRKYPKAERATRYTRLSDENNWYLPTNPKRWE